MCGCQLRMTMMRLVVAICGKKGSGKDVIAKHLEARHGFAHVKVAGPLKECVRSLFGISTEQIEDPVLKETIDPRYGASPRRLMQFMGTEVMRDLFARSFPVVGAEFWTHALVRQIGRTGRDRIVVSDMRFVNEFAALTREADTLVHVIRVNRARERTSTSVVEDSHVSETEFETIPADHVVDNDADIDSLLRRVDDVIEVVLERCRNIST